MSNNRIFLDQDGLSVGGTQLNASGGGVTVGQNLRVLGTFYANSVRPTKLTTANWTTATRPVNPVNGAMGYNSQLNLMEYYICLLYTSDAADE